MRKTLLILAFTLGCSALSFGWGFLGHKVIQQLAIYALPKQMQGFYHRHMAYLVDNSVRPDERRNSDPDEAPLHFIDVDVYGPNAVNEMPESWAAASAQYPIDTLTKYGLVPWHVVEMKKHLTRAFQMKNSDSILFYSADLAHYIQDAHVPLHTTVNYDGQLSGQPGLHSLWESKLPELHLNQYCLQTKKASYLQNPEHQIWEVVRASHKLLPELLAQERIVSGDFTDQTKFNVTERNGRTRKYYSDEFAKAYQKALGNTVQSRMQAAAAQTASFWYTCWVDGGKPDLEALLSSPRTKAEEKQLKRERKAWKKGSLQSEDLLLTKPRS
ncbi:zinc dependent phospholipase C family protein [Rufibacter roseus]|uniref:Zinc dependent phospholipase C family protein n=1 Tax=Rufibacter roseus TaxID=1567108 RepID=A0ABW2DJ57_9BACT|nr:zinc dependent phospholipase C family protein [Rufibacter roseus]